MNDPFENPSAMLRWFEMPEGIAFIAYIENMLDSSQARLERESETMEIFRRQGRITALKDIFHLPDELHRAMGKKVT